MTADDAYSAAMDDLSPPTTPLRHMLWLAWLLSAIYLAAGAMIAFANRVSHGHLGRLALAMDLFAASFLRMVHLWHPLLDAMGNGHLETWEIRVVMMSISVALIFTYALTVGLLLNGLRTLWERLGPR